MANGEHNKSRLEALLCNAQLKAIQIKIDICTDVYNHVETSTLAKEGFGLKETQSKTSETKVAVETGSMDVYAVCDSSVRGVFWGHHKRGGGGGDDVSQRLLVLHSSGHCWRKPTLFFFL